MTEVVKTEASYSVNIFIAGEIADARRICREHTLAVGLCVTLAPTEFIYTGGAESGVCIGLVNYPRFPEEPSIIWARAETLARLLIEGLSQHSALIVAPDRTTWITRRDQAIR